MHVDKSFTKIQARVRPPSPIQAMPEFWEHLDLEPLPMFNTFLSNNKAETNITLILYSLYFNAY